VADAFPVRRREPQVGVEGPPIGEKALGGGGQLALISAGEGVDVGLRRTDGRLAWVDVFGRVEDLPERGLELVAVQFRLMRGPTEPLRHAS